MKPALDSVDINTESAVRRVGAGSEQINSLFQGVRQSGVSGVTGAVTHDTRAHRLTAVGMQAGDCWLETDTGWEYLFDGVSWLWVLGVNTGTDGQRGALSLSSADNGALFFTTDGLVLWEVQAAAWVKLLEIKGAANQITATIVAGVLTLSLPASVTVATGYQVGGSQIIGARKAGWTLPTSTQTRTVADYSLLTLPQLAEVVAALVNDLHAGGGTQQKLLST